MQLFLRPDFMRRQFHERSLHRVGSVDVTVKGKNKALVQVSLKVVISVKLN